MSKILFQRDADGNITVSAQNYGIIGLIIVVFIVGAVFLAFAGRPYTL